MTQFIPLCNQYIEIRQILGRVARFAATHLVAVMVMIIECGLFQMVQLREVEVEGEGDINLLGDQELRRVASLCMGRPTITTPSIDE